MTNEKYFLDWAKEYEDSAEEKKKVGLSEQMRKKSW